MTDHEVRHMMNEVLFRMEGDLTAFDPETGWFSVQLANRNNIQMIIHVGVTRAEIKKVGECSDASGSG